VKKLCEPFVKLANVSTTGPDLLVCNGRTIPSLCEVQPRSQFSCARKRIPKGFRIAAQGSSCLATLGCMTQSLWDWLAGHACLARNDRTAIGPRLCEPQQPLRTENSTNSNGACIGEAAAAHRAAVRDTGFMAQAGARAVVLSPFFQAGKKLVDVRPHPNPLPRGEGELLCVTGKILRHHFNLRHSCVQARNLPITCNAHNVCDGRTILPLPGRGEGDHFLQLPPCISSGD